MWRESAGHKKSEGRARAREREQRERERARGPRAGRPPGEQTDAEQPPNLITVAKATQRLAHTLQLSLTPGRKGGVGGSQSHPNPPWKWREPGPSQPIARGLDTRRVV